MKRLSRLDRLMQLGRSDARGPGRGVYVPPAPTRISLGSGIPLDLAIGDGGVQGVAGGPVWTGGGYWSSDGVGYWTGPSTSPADWTFVVRSTRSGVSSNHRLAEAHTTAWIRETVARMEFGLATLISIPISTSKPTTFLRQSNGGNIYFATDGQAETTTAKANSALSILLGKAGGSVCTSGQEIWEAALYDSGLSTADQAALYNSGTQADFRTLIATQPWAYWDFALAESDGLGGYRVPDLVLGDHTRDLVAVSTDLTDITTGATF